MAPRLASLSFSSSSFSSSSPSPSSAAAGAVAGFKPYVPSLRTSSSSWSKNDIGGDRFIPVRLPGSAHYLPITKKPAADDDDAAEAAAASSSPSRFFYRRALADACLRDRVLTFRVRPVARPGPLEEELKPEAKQRTRWRLPKAPSAILDVPGIQDNFYLNLLDWGSSNVLAVAHGDTVFLWDDSKKSTIGSMCFLDCPVTSLGWSPDGQNIAIGLVPSGNLEIFDLDSRRTRRVLSDSDLNFGTRVTSLAWKDDNVLATGGPDCEILLHDLRLESPVVQTFRGGHDGDICALKWSDSGRHLASGGDVDLLHIWDICMTTSTAHRKPWLHRMTDHTSTVKALAWCPFQSNLLASGGNSDDCCIKFWNTSTGCLLNSMDTGGAEVFSLQWSRHARQLISSHGGPRNQLNVWRYPSMAKAGELIGHQDRAMFTSQSPDGYTVASASSDESVMLWKFCADSSEVPKPKPKVPNWGPFSSSSFSHIRFIMSAHIDHNQKKKLFI